MTKKKKKKEKINKYVVSPQTLEWERRVLLFNVNERSEVEKLDVLKFWCFKVFGPIHTLYILKLF